MVQLRLPRLLNVHHFKIEPLRPVQLQPQVPFQPVRDQKLVGGLDRKLGQLINDGGLPFLAGAQRLASHVAPVDFRVGGQDPERSRVAGHLKVRVVEYVLPARRVHLVVEPDHLINLALHLVPNFVDNLVWVAGLLALALPQDDHMGPLDVAALFQLGHSFRGNVPVLHDLEPGTPEDLSHVGPGLGVLVGELDNLETVVRHVVRHGLVGFYHRGFERLTFALDREVPTRVPYPLIEGGWWIFPEPGNEEFRDFIVINGIRIGRICQINV